MSLLMVFDYFSEIYQNTKRIEIYLKITKVPIPLNYFEMAFNVVKLFIFQL